MYVQNKKQKLKIMKQGGVKNSFDRYIFKFFHALINFYGIMEQVIYDNREEN